MERIQQNRKRRKKQTLKNKIEVVISNLKESDYLMKIDTSIEVVKKKVGGKGCSEYG